MAQNTHQKKASARVAAWMAHNEVSNAWLAEKAKADLGTIGDFLNGFRWPKKTTQGRIEKALGWPAGTIHQIGQGEDVETPLDRTVGGSGEGAASSDTEFVESPGVKVDAGITNEDLLREILRSRAEYDQLRAEVRDLSGRVERIERGS